MTDYISNHTGAQIDSNIDKVINNDCKVKYGNFIGNLSEQIDLYNSINARESKSNKVTSISSVSTDDQYPSAKCVYDIVGNIGAVLDAIIGE
jgi:hypothetical protein